MKRTVLVGLAVLLLGGCVTQKIDWSARVGHYTYNQAVKELGPPDKSAKLSNGATVAEWLTQPGQVTVAPEPYFVPHGCYFGPLTPMYSESYVPARYLRLYFDANGTLKAWNKFTK
jgi:hypothetical protein